MLKGSLQISHGLYYVIVYYKNRFGKTKQKWISTGLKEKGNKTRATKKMKEILKSIELEDEIYQPKDDKDTVLFVTFLESYLEIKKDQVEPVTAEMYRKLTKDIVKYFRDMRLKITEVKPFHIEGFYNDLYSRGLSKNSVLKYHVLLRQCMQYAFVNELVLFNVVDKVKRPRIEKYKASFYTAEEMENLIQVVEKIECRMPILLAAMYGLRRSEALGLKWDAIDFKTKRIHIRHKVIETKINGKICMYRSDKMKNETSNRTLPLLPKMEKYLLDRQEEIKYNMKTMGKSYNTKYLDYVCVDNIGKLITPDRLTKNFAKILKNNDLRKIRFHDLRHTCASLMLANDVPMKQIQEWLGHADFGTTANIYSHLDFSSKIDSANAITHIFNFGEEHYGELSDGKSKVKQSNHMEELEKELEELKEKLIQREVDELKEKIAQQEKIESNALACNSKEESRVLEWKDCKERRRKIEEDIEM